MTRSTSDWHNRFRHQAGWTASVRAYLLNRIPDSSNLKILEVGCGTGAIIDSLRNQIENPTGQKNSGKEHPSLFGVDINQDFLSFAQNSNDIAFFTLADGNYLPFEDDKFDITCTHFLLMWLKNPVIILREIVRVTRPGSYIFIFAEPDYGGRIDYPHELEPISKVQIKSLQKQGGDPFYGRKLSSHLIEAGLSSIEIGVLGGNWKISDLINDFQMEWQTLDSDLKHFNPGLDLVSVRNKDEQYRREGKRVLFVPTFYAFGIKRAMPDVK